MALNPYSNAADEFPQQVADLRASVAASETSPVTVADLFNRAVGLAAAWAITLDK